MVNPTNVLNKAQAFAHVGADVLALSETSAVAQVQKITGSDLPPTCKNSTRHDTALLHPDLLPLWHSAWVMKDSQLFDAHDPLCFRLQLPAIRPSRHVWRLPRSWSDLGVQPHSLSKAFQAKYHPLLVQAQSCASRHDIDAALQAFSGAVEDAVDAALKTQHWEDPVRNPYRSLPRQCRGRCVERPIKCREYACLARPDCTGGYNPDVEVTSVLGRLRVRQVRRIHTLARGLGKCRGTGLPAQPAVLSQLRQEWAAICAAKGYAPSFPVWTLRVACFTSYPDDLPSSAWLEDLLQYVRYDCDALVRQQAQQHRWCLQQAISVGNQVLHMQGPRALQQRSSRP